MPDRRRPPRTPSGRLPHPAYAARGADVVLGGFAAAVVEVAQHLDGVHVRTRTFETGSRGLQVRVEQTAVDVGQRASITFLMAISSA